MANIIEKIRYSDEDFEEFYIDDYGKLKDLETTLNRVLLTCYGLYKG